MNATASVGGSLPAFEGVSMKYSTVSKNRKRVTACTSVDRQWPVEAVSNSTVIKKSNCSKKPSCQADVMAVSNESMKLIFEDS